MENTYNKKFGLKIIAVILVFFVAFMPFHSIKKVYANALEGSTASIIVALLLSGLVASGAISGGYKVSPADLSSITEKAQANLQAAGSAAIDQANKLGEAIKSGAESAKIKALASGAVIYAFLQAIQETLFINDYSASVPGGLIFVGAIKDKILVQTHAKYMAPTSGYNVGYKGITGNLVPAAEHFNVPVPSNYGNYNYDVSQFRLYESDGAYSQILVASNTSDYNSGYHVFLPYTAIGNCAGAILGITERVQLVDAGIIYDPTINNVSEKDSITLPTVLPPTIINNITNWDGTSDLVLSPPLPYDIPDDEALVVDPTYGGEVIDPTDPVDPPAEEGTIVLPWLAALLGLLGLGNPSLEGIEAGVKTAIDKLIEGITATTQDVFDGSKEIFGNITDALTGIDAGIQSGIDALTGSISVPLANIADFALSVPDFFAIPEGKSIATPIIEQIPQVFPIVDQMNTALNKITVETRPLIIYYPYLDGSNKEINLNWYEPAREQVKHGVGLLFKVVTALACFAMISNVFGIGIRVGAGQAYTDNNSGGSNGGNSRKKGD